MTPGRRAHPASLSRVAEIGPRSRMSEDPACGFLMGGGALLGSFSIRWRFEPDGGGDGSSSACRGHASASDRRAGPSGVMADGRASDAVQPGGRDGLSSPLHGHLGGRLRDLRLARVDVVMDLRVEVRLRLLEPASRVVSPFQGFRSPPHATPLTVAARPGMPHPPSLRGRPSVRAVTVQVCPPAKTRRRIRPTITHVRRARPIRQARDVNTGHTAVLRSPAATPQLRAPQGTPTQPLDCS